MTHKKPTTKRLLFSLLALCMAAALYVGKPRLVLAADDAQLTDIETLVARGAPGLALRIMDRQQAELKPDPSRWLAWERQRLAIYAAMRDWTTLIERVEQLPETLPDEYRRWALTQQARAYHELKQGQQARLVIRRLFIDSSGQSDEPTLAWLQRWRRFIIQSYLADGMVDDAYTAIIRFQQDYPVQSEDVLLRAKVLLMSDRADEVTELLQKHRSKPEAAMLYLLAQLRSEQRTPLQVIKIALQKLRDKKNKAINTALWGLVAEAAQQVADYNNSVKALEHVLAETDQPVRANLFEFSADSLWQAYMDYALQLGNRAQLLMGEDQSWLREAEKFHKGETRKARAYYALLIRRGVSADTRRHAAAQLLRLLKRRSGEQGERLIQVLFTQSRYYPSTFDIPELVRHELVDIALAQQDIPLASEIMASLNKPPKGNTSYMWYLRRARILVLGGQARKGAEVLKDFLQDNPDVNQTQIDRLLQVVFDLQTVKEHDAAYALFQQIIDLGPEAKTQRELYYWMAESRKDQERYDEAAQLYLKSAFLLAEGLDPWGQTARYQAAESLAQAGLRDDAFNLFQQLLRTTKEVDRRAVLQHEIEKLNLSRHNSDEGPGTGDEELETGH